MKKKRRAIVIFSTLALIALWLVWPLVHLREPQYQGKTLSAWLDESANDGDMNLLLPRREDKNERQIAIRAIGAKGIPVLLRKIRTSDNPLTKMLLACARYSPVLIRVRDSLWTEQEGMYGFCVLGSEAKSAIPQLTTLLQHPNGHVRVSAALSLAGIGETNSLPDLEKYLGSVLGSQSDGPEDWRGSEISCAIRAIGQFGPCAQSAIPQIAPLASTNISAKAAMIRITGQGLEAVSEGLKNTTNFQAWLLGADVAEQLGQDGKLLVPALIDRLQDTNQFVQATSLYLLGVIHGQPGKCITAIKPLLNSQSADGSIRCSAFRAISAFGMDAQPWIYPSEIASFLSDPDSGVRREATNALRRVCPEDAAKLGIK